MKPLACSLAIALCAVPFSARGQDAEGLDLPGAAALFKWYDGLGFPDVTGKPLVLVKGVQAGGWARLGALLEAGEERFVVVHEAEAVTYSRASGATHEALDLAMVAQRVARGSEAVPEEFVLGMDRLGVLALAHLAFQSGEQDLALALLKRAAGLEGRSAEGRGLREQIHHDLAQTSMGEALNGYVSGPSAAS